MKIVAGSGRETKITGDEAEIPFDPMKFYMEQKITSEFYNRQEALQARLRIELMEQNWLDFWYRIDHPNVLDYMYFSGFSKVVGDKLVVHYNFKAALVLPKLSWYKRIFDTKWKRARRWEEWTGRNTETVKFESNFSITDFGMPSGMMKYPH